MQMINIGTNKYIFNLELARYITTVTGKSGSGKSFLFSALKSAVAQQNLPGYVFVDTSEEALSLSDDIAHSVIFVDKIEQMSEEARDNLSEFLNVNYSGSHGVHTVVFARGRKEFLLGPVEAEYEVNVSMHPEGKLMFTLIRKEGV